MAVTASCLTLSYGQSGAKACPILTRAVARSLLPELAFLLCLQGLLSYAAVLGGVYDVYPHQDARLHALSGLGWRAAAIPPTAWLEGAVRGFNSYEPGERVVAGALQFSEAVRVHENQCLAPLRRTQTFYSRWSREVVQRFSINNQLL